MKINRVKTNSSYTVINNTCLRDKRISEKAKGVYAMIMTLPPDWDLSIKGFTKICFSGIDSIRNAFTELEKFGYCKRARKRNKNGTLGASEYTFYDEPTIQPKLDNPILDNPTLDNPTLDNPTQLNTDIIKDLTKESKDLNNLRDFDKFWDLYSKKTGKQKCMEKWKLLKQDVKDKILLHVPKYVLATPEERYRKDPLTYLRNESWEDEFLPNQNNQPQSLILKY